MNQNHQFSTTHVYTLRIIIVKYDGTNLKAKLVIEVGPSSWVTAVSPDKTIL